MKKYWRIYKIFFANSLSFEAQYRKHTFFHLITSVIYISVVFLTIHILFQYADTIGNWSKGEVFLLSTIWIIVDEIVILLFEANIKSIPDRVTDGEMDLYLTKPVNSLFLLSGQTLYLNTVYKILMDIGILAFIISYFDISLTFIGIATSLFLILCALVVIYSVLVLLNTLSFWFYRIDNINNLWFGFYDFGRYPIHILPKAMRIIFLTAIPIVYTAYFPTMALTGKLSWWILAFVPIFSFLMLLAAIKFWKYALKHYTSASS